MRGNAYPACPWVLLRTVRPRGLCVSRPLTRFEYAAVRGPMRAASSDSTIDKVKACNTKVQGRVAAHTAVSFSLLRYACLLVQPSSELCPGWATCCQCSLHTFLLALGGARHSWSILTSASLGPSAVLLPALPPEHLRAGTAQTRALHPGAWASRCRLHSCCDARAVWGPARSQVARSYPRTTALTRCSPEWKCG